MKDMLGHFYDRFQSPAFESPEMEKSYWEWNDRNKLAHRKIFLFLAIITIALIGLLDVLMAGAIAPALLTIRVITVSMLTAIFIRFQSDSTPEQREWHIFLFGMTATMSIIIMTVVAPRPAADFYPFLLSATMVFGSALVVPRFSSLALMCIIANCIYWPTVYFSQTSLPAIYANIVVMSIATFSVVAGAFAREQLEREQKLYRDRLAETREEAIAARDAAIQANQAKSHLLANVSHELRTPMNAILGFSEVMKHQIYGPIHQDQYREYVNDIHFAGSLLQANINDLLDVSRLEVNKMSWTDDWSPITEIVERTVNTCTRDVTAANINLKQDLHDANLMIHCDPERTAQILINLVTNAVKFSDPGSEITISSSESDAYTELSVIDQGCGIPDQHIEEIIEPFRQVASNSLTTQKGGMGLGLSIVKGLVEKLEGQLAIESELGHGTKVTVKVPSHRIRKLAHKDQPSALALASAN